MPTLNLEVKFKIGDTAYYISNGVEKKCNLCKGTGCISLDKESYTCPKCNGSGKIIDTKSKQIKFARVVGRFLHTTLTSNVEEYDIEIDADNTYFLASDLFITEVEAEATLNPNSKKFKLPVYSPVKRSKCKRKSQNNVIEKTAKGLRSKK